MLSAARWLDQVLLKTIQLRTTELRTSFIPIIVCVFFDHLIRCFLLPWQWSCCAFLLWLVKHAPKARQNRRFSR